MTQTEQSLTSKLMNEKDIPNEKKEDHKFYGYRIGRIKNPQTLSKYNISDPSCQIVLKDAEFYVDDATTCFQQKTLEIFYSKQKTVKQLEDAIKDHMKDGSKYFNQYVSKAKQNVTKFSKAYSISDEEAYGCCLALSCYTGVYSERISRTCTLIIKLYVKNSSSNIKDTAEYQAMKCIQHWLFRALSCIPLYWGQVTRCVNLKPEQSALYSIGNIVTWLQFSSSSYGSITPYFAVRNTRFIIYSLSGRCIQQYSNYSNEITQSQVLFKPFSHFIVFNRKSEGPIEYIYMRQIFIGQSKRNVLWVDDHIFEKDWENKLIMERAMSCDPLLNIIPKVSTQCALAFLRSQIGQQRNASQLRLMSDMTRQNEQPSGNAGGRFLSECQQMQLKNKKMIFTSSQEKAEKILKTLGVLMEDLKISTFTQEALSFLLFR